MLDSGGWGVVSTQGILATYLTVEIYSRAIRVVFCYLLSHTFSSEMTVYLLEKSVMGGSRCLLAGDVYMFLQKNLVCTVSSLIPVMYSALSLHTYTPSTSLQAQLQKTGVTHIYPRTGFTDENLKIYLQHPPPGKISM